MSKYPLKVFLFFPLIIIGVFFLCGIAFGQQQDLTALQNQARIYHEQGRQLQRQGNITEALTYYQKALLVDPSYVEAYNDAGIILEARGDIEQAKEMYLKAIDINPRYPNSYSNLALLYEGQKDYTSAIMCWIKRAVLGGPQDPWAEAARKRMEEIARAYPEAFSKIGDKFKEDFFKDPSKLGLFSEDIASFDKENIDNKARALDYLARAKKNFSQHEYVAALKEATVAQYLDSSNKEINAFVEKLRKVLLQ